MQAVASQRWSPDFVHQELASGKRRPVPNVVDDLISKCLTAVVDRSIKELRVVQELGRLIAKRGKPGYDRQRQLIRSGSTRRELAESLRCVDV